MGILDKFGVSITPDVVASFGTRKDEPDTLAHLSEYIKEASQETGLDPNLIRGLIEHESSGRVDARPIDPTTGKPLSSAYGPTQLTDSAAEEVGVNKYDPRENVIGGARYLKKQIDSFGDVNTGLVAYFKGPGAVQQYGANVPGTTGGNTAPDYVSDILSRKAKYDQRDTEKIEAAFSNPSLDAMFSKFGTKSATKKPVGATRSFDAPVLTKLPIEDEQRFREFYAQVAEKNGLNPNPDDPAHFYDYRAAWKAGSTPDSTGHWPSQFKLEGHPRMVVDGVNTKTGQLIDASTGKPIQQVPAPGGAKPKGGILTPAKAFVSGAATMAGDVFQGLYEYLASDSNRKAKAIKSLTGIDIKDPKKDAAFSESVRKVAQGIRELPPEKWEKEVAAVTEGDLWTPDNPLRMTNTWVSLAAQNAPQYLTNLAGPQASAGALVLREAGSFGEAASRLGIPDEIKTKYTEAYSVPAGLSEYVDNVMMLGLNKVPIAKGLADKAKSGIIGGLSKKFGPTAARALEKTGEFAGIGAVEGAQELGQNAYLSYMLGSAAKEAGLNVEELRAQGKLPPMVDWKSFAMGAGIGIITKGAVEIGKASATKLSQPKGAPQTAPVTPQTLETPVAPTPATPEAPDQDIAAQEEAVRKSIAEAPEKPPSDISFQPFEPGTLVDPTPEEAASAQNLADEVKKSGLEMKVDGDKAPKIGQGFVLKDGTVSPPQVSVTITSKGKETTFQLPVTATIEDVKTKYEEAIAKPGFERRKGKRVDEMTPEEMRESLLIDEKTGLGSARRWNERRDEFLGAEQAKRPAPHEKQAYIDIDGLKFVNDNLGHHVGDLLLNAFAGVMIENGITVDRTGGDEFRAVGENDLDAKIEKARGDLAKRTIRVTLENGDVAEFPGGFSYGTERNNIGFDAAGKEAERKLYEDKASRAKSGLRASRAGELPGFSRTSPSKGPEGKEDRGVVAPTTTTEPQKGVPNVQEETPPVLKTEGAAQVAPDARSVIQSVMDNNVRRASVKQREMDPQEYFKKNKFSEESIDNLTAQLTEAVENKDPVRLRNLLWLHNKGWRAGFEKLTGIKLPKTEKGTADAIRQFVGPEKYDASQVEGKQKREQIAKEQEDKRKAKELDNELKAQIQTSWNQGEEPKVMSMREYFDAAIDHGFTQIVEKPAGKSTMYLMTTGERTRKIGRKKIVAEYFKSRVAEKAGKTAPKTEEAKKPEVVAPEAPKKPESAPKAKSGAKEFYISTKDGFKKVDAKPVVIDGAEDHDFFIRKDEDDQWVISHAKTGAVVRRGEVGGSRQHVIDRLVEMIQIAGKENLEKAVSRAIEKTGISPAYEEKVPAVKPEEPKKGEVVLTPETAREAYLNDKKVRWSSQADMDDKGPMKIMHMTSNGAMKVEGAKVYYNPDNFVLAEDAPAKKEPVRFDPEGVVPGTSDLVAAVQKAIEGGTTLDNPKLTALANAAFKGTQAQGTYGPRDSYDAAEAALNSVIEGRGVDFDDPEGSIQKLQKLTDQMPRQTDRTNEQVELQQFSTPPAEAFVVVYASGIKKGMKVLEPSAGTGNIATQAKLKGGDVITNEIAPRRLGILEYLGFKTTKVSGEQLDNLLPTDIEPDVVVMNPPFSATGGRVAAHKTTFGARHVEQALQRLKPGGRLVAIVGGGMGHDKAGFQKWWTDIEGKYNVRANLGMKGSVYGKYGTTFDNNILVIDKTGPTPGEGRAARVKNIIRGDSMTPLEAVKVLENLSKEDVYGRISRESGKVSPKKAGDTTEKQEPSTSGSGERTPGRGGRKPSPDTRGTTDRGTVGDVAGLGENEPGVRGEPSGEGDTRGGRKDQGGDREGVEGKPDREPEGGAGATTDRGPAGTGVKDRARAILQKKLEKRGLVATKIKEETKLRDDSLSRAEDAAKRLLASLSNQKPGHLGTIGSEQIELGFEVVSNLIEAGVHEFNALALKLQEIIGDAVNNAEFKQVIEDSYDSYTEVDDTLPKRSKSFDEAVKPVETSEVETKKAEKGEEQEGGVFSEYKVQKAHVKGSKKHPANIVESATLATVEPPDVTYKPSIPKEVVESGKLSDVQLEAVIYSGQRHEQRLPDGSRAESLINDGTGLGKGREIAGIILDNYMKGRKKHLWISVGRDLFTDAQRDLYTEKERHLASGFNPERKLGGIGVPLKIIDVGAIKVEEEISDKEGILFIPYTLLAGEWGKGKRRFEQVKKWLGDDFDGVIAFDEAHKMKNALAAGIGGKIGDGTNQGAAGMLLKSTFKDARVINVSATAATTPANLGYLTRMGLWGPGTAFPNFPAFIGAMQAGGVGAMEMLARDLKAIGASVARIISYKGKTAKDTVQYESLIHEMTPEEKTQYDEVALMWSKIMKAFDEAAKNAGMGKNKSNKFSAFYSSQQRFFLQYMMSFQLNDMLKAASKDLEDGKSVVISMYNTNEGATKKAVGEAKANDIDLEDIDFTPREMIASLIKENFPVQQYEDVTDPITGKTTPVPMKHKDGSPVINRENQRAQEELLETVSRMSMPTNPMDAIVNYFGADKVAEITGRSKRLEGGRYDPKSKSITGKVKYVTTAVKGISKDKRRNEQIQQFQSGRKKVALISGAASTGISLHSDANAKNQDRRVFYAMQLSWSADTQMQAFGRVHRAFQTSAPIIKLVQVDVAGQKRLVNTVASRLASVGAVSTGTREAYSGGIFAVEDITDENGEAALGELYSRTGDYYADFEQMGILNEDGNIKGSSEGNVDQFLNRIMALPVDRQNLLYDEFYKSYQRIVETAKENGTFDSGVEHLNATDVKQVGKSEVINVHSSGARTELVTLEGSVKNHTRSFDAIVKVAGDKNLAFARNNKSGKLWAAYTSWSPGKFWLEAPNGSRHSVRSDDITRENYTRLTTEEAKKEWDAEYAKIPEYSRKKFYLITGAVYPIYNKLFKPGMKSKIVRTTTTSGEGFVGVRIDEKDIVGVKTRLGIGSALKNATSQEIYNLIRENDSPIEFDNGWVIKGTKVHGEDRIEVDYRATTPPNREEMVNYGTNEVMVDYRKRYFVPVDPEEGPAVIGKIMKNHKPIRDISVAQEESSDDPQAMSAKTWDFPLEPEASTEKRTTLTEIWRFVEKSFNLALRGRATHKWKNAGMYYPKAWVARLRKWGDIPPMTHEVAHHIDMVMKKKLGSDWKTKAGPVALRELKSLDYEPKNRIPEGFAEWVRIYLTSEKDMAPEFSKHFRTVIKSEPKLEEAMNELGKMIGTWRSMGSTNRVISQIDMKGEHTNLPLAQKTAVYRRWLVEKFIDTLDSFSRVNKALGLVSRKNIRPSQDPVEYARRVMSKSRAIARTFVKEKAINSQGEIVGRGLTEILSPITVGSKSLGEANEKMKVFLAYAVAKRAKNLEKRGIESGFDKEDIDNVLNEYKSKAWDDIVDDITKWNNNVTDWLVEAGSLSEADAAVMRELNPSYVPFKRAFVDEALAIKTGGGLGGGINTGKGVHRIKGSGRPIINPIESMVSQVTSIIEKANKVHVARLFADMADKEGMGRFIKPVPAPMEGTKINIDTVVAQLKKMGLEVENLADVDTDALMTVFTQAAQYRGKDNIIQIWRGGKREFYEVDPEIYRAMLSMDVQKRNLLQKILAPFSRMIRLGATGLNVAFSVATNPGRDIPTFLTFSKKRLANPKDILTGLAKSINPEEGSLFWRYRALGGTMSGMMGYDRVSTMRVYDEILSENLKGMGKALYVARNPMATIDWLTDVLSFMEQAPRSAELHAMYKEYREKHPDWTEEDAFIAAFNDAQDVTVNFTRGGQVSKALNETNAFFNVAIQGPDKLYRMFRDRPAETALKGLLWMTLPAVLSWAWNRDKEWWKNLPLEYKYSSYFFELPGGNILRIPTPFELGLLFAGIPMAIMDQEKGAGEALLNSIVRMIPNIVPSAAEPILDVAMNKDYLWRPIESLGMRRLPVEERKHSYTNALAVMASRGLTKIGAQLSPIQIEYILNSYTGGFARQIPTRGFKEAADIPVVGRLLVRMPEDPKRQTNAFFKDYTRLQQQYDAEKIKSVDDLAKYQVLKDFYYGYWRDFSKVMKLAIEKNNQPIIKALHEDLANNLKLLGY